MALFNSAVRRKRLRENPVLETKKYAGEHKAPTRHLTLEDEERLLRACGEGGKVIVPARRNLGGRRRGKVFAEKREFTQEVAPPDWLEPLVLVVLRRGFRRATLLNLHWQDLDLAARRWRIPAERMKGGQAHEAPVSEEVLRALSEYRSRLTARCAQLGQNPPERVGEEALLFGLAKTTGVHRPYQAASRRAGLSLTLHNPRGCVLNRCAEAGVDLATAMRLLSAREESLVLEIFVAPDVPPGCFLSVPADEIAEGETRTSGRDRSRAAPPRMPRALLDTEGVRGGKFGISTHRSTPRPSARPTT